MTIESVHKYRYPGDLISVDGSYEVIRLITIDLLVITMWCCQCLAGDKDSDHRYACVPSLVFLCDNET